MKVIEAINLTKNLVFSRTLRSQCRFIKKHSSAKFEKYSYDVKKRLNAMPIKTKNYVTLKKEAYVPNRSPRLTDIKKSLSERFDVTFDETPVKSENDTKEYLVMKLSNGLTALLISDVNHMMDASHFKSDNITSSEIIEFGVAEESKDDDLKPKEKLAACSMTVNAGSFNDPIDIPGLAHLLEHMLFMGSEQFPDENDFNSYVTSRGGSNNAVTDCEYTTFFFDCPEVFLEETINRFANFFIAPLMKRETMVRERKAIESEFQMHSKNDALRIMQIISSTAPMTNPVHKFMWGNFKTLRDNISEEKLYNSLRKFWKTNYSAHRMTVAVQARLPLSTLGRWVVNHFGKVSKNDEAKELFPYTDPPFETKSFNRLYTVMPVSDINMLRLTWALPPIRHLYKSKPTLYTSFIIGSEGKGSLISYLKKNLWALSLVSGSGTDGTENNSTFSLFSIGILLTESGLANIEKVLCSVFSFIKLLKIERPSKMVSKELQFMAETNFRFSPEPLSSDNVQYLSHCMQLYPPEDYMTGSRLMFDYKPEQITNFLELLTPDKVNVMLVSKTAANEVKLDKKEKWFETRFNARDIPRRWMDEWRACKLNLNFYLPEANPFIPSDFRILSRDAPAGKLEIYPEKLISDNNMELWFKQDQKFKLPFGYVNIYLISPHSTTLPHTFVMCDLFASLFSTVCDEELFPSSVAGMGYSLSAGDHGFFLGVSGYNEKLQMFLETTLNLMMSFCRNVTPGIFEAVKEEQRKCYYNDLLNPTILAKELRLSLLCEPFCSSIMKLEAITSVDLKKLQDYCNYFFESLYVKCLIQGNVSKGHALNISKKIKDVFKYSPLLPGCRPEIRVRRLPKGERVIRVKALNEDDRNCHVINYYQCGLSHDVKESCIVELLMMNMIEPLFDTLRTKEQLGYLVNNDIKYTYGVLGFSVSVKFQSDKFTCRHVESRMTEFMNKMKTELKDMTPETFNRLKESMKVLKLQADTQLIDEVERNWSEIESNEYVFDRLKRELSYIETLEKVDLYEYFITALEAADRTGDVNRCLRKLSVQVDASEKTSKAKTHHSICTAPNNNLKHILEFSIPNEREENISEFIRNIEDFQKSLYIYPVLKLKL